MEFVDSHLKKSFLEFISLNLNYFSCPNPKAGESRESNPGTAWTGKTAMILGDYQVPDRIFHQLDSQFLLFFLTIVSLNIMIVS